MRSRRNSTTSVHTKKSRAGKDLVYKGDKLKSGNELRVAQELVRYKIPYKYESICLDYNSSVYRGVCLECDSCSVVSRRRYTPDFILNVGDTLVLLEVKGKFTSLNRKLMKDVVASNPQYDIRLVFQKNNKITKTSQHRYSDWCDRNNIRWCVGELSKDWIKEFKS